MTAKKRGRPSKAPKKGERNSLGFRVTADLKKKLMQSAEASGRSVSQDAEFRLEQSFSVENVLAQMIGSPAVLALCVIAGQAIRLVEKETGKIWTEDEETNQEARRAAALTANAIPKSATIGRPSWRRRFSGLMSRWMTLFRCA